MNKDNHPLTKIRNKYFKKIEFIINTFSSHELKDFIEDSLIPPKTQLDNYFSTADEALLDADLLKYERSLKRFITDLECFKLRINDKNRKQRLWNPLDEEFGEFIKKNNNVEYYYANTPYPPYEVIIEWLEQ